MADNMNIKVVGLKELDMYFKKFPAASNQAIERAIKKVTLKTERDYTLNLRNNKSTGDLESSIFSKISRFFGIVGSDSIVSKFIEFGTRPHKIKIKNKKVLSDKVDFFGKEVQHPGYRGNPALSRAYFKNVGVSGKKLINRLREEFKKIK